MPNIASLEMQNPLAIPAFLALLTQKSPTRFHEDPEIYWDIELAPSMDASAMPNRTIVEYKDIWSGTQLDPNGTSNGGAGLFRDPVYGPGTPENSLSGTIFTVDDLGGLDNITIPASMSQYRFWANTSIASGNGGTLTRCSVTSGTVISTTASGQPG